MIKHNQGSVLLFDRHKYTWLIIGLIVTAVGFLLMIGGGSDDPAVFDDAIFSFRRLTLAPVLVLGGYAIQIYAIMKKTTNTVDDPKERQFTGQKRPTGQPQKKHKQKR